MALQTRWLNRNESGRGKAPCLKDSDNVAGDERGEPCTPVSGKGQETQKKRHDEDLPGQGSAYVVPCRAPL